MKIQNKSKLQRAARILTLLFFHFAAGTVFAQEGPSPLQGKGSLVLQGRVVNASTGLPARADRIALYSMESEMRLIEKLDGGGMVFRFAPIAIPNNPILIGVDYHGETYFKMIHPGDPDLTAPRVVAVYDGGANPDAVGITSMTRITKTEKGLHVEKVFAIMNSANPPRLFTTENLRLNLPDSAEDVSGYLQLESTNLSLPLPLEKKDHGWIFARAFRPGSSTLFVSYNVKGNILREAPTELTALDGRLPRLHDFRIVSWKPEDLQPKASGVTLETIKAPGLGNAKKMTLVEGSKEITLDFSSGGYFMSNLLDAHANPVFGSPWKSLLGLFLFLVLLFLAIPRIAILLEGHERL